MRVQTCSRAPLVSETPSANRYGADLAVRFSCDRRQGVVVFPATYQTERSSGEAPMATRGSVLTPGAPVVEVEEEEHGRGRWLQGTPFLISVTTERLCRRSYGLLLPPRFLTPTKLLDDLLLPSLSTRAPSLLSYLLVHSWPSFPSLLHSFFYLFLLCFFAFLLCS